MISNILPTYVAFLDGDYKQLNNALWQTGRTRIDERGFVASGTIYTDGILRAYLPLLLVTIFQSFHLSSQKISPFTERNLLSRKCHQSFLRSLLSR